MGASSEGGIEQRPPGGDGVDGLSCKTWEQRSRQGNTRQCEDEAGVPGAFEEWNVLRSGPQ